jgi:NAD(P)-dependent dehydrogenase (short-subunit alcohol dehydrogenase family)
MPAELAAQLLADLHGDPALARPRRLARGAVLPDGHLDLCDLDVDTTAAVLAALAPARPRGLWLAALDHAATLSAVLAAHPQLEHLGLAAPLAPAALASLDALTGLRSLALTLPPGADLSVLLDMLPGTALAHLHLAGPLDDRAADALAAALRRGAPWRTLRVPALTPTAELLAAAERSDLARLDVSAPLPPALLARLCHNANRARVTPPPDLARLRLRLPATPEPAPPLPGGLDPGDLDACRRVLKAMSLQTGRMRADHPQLADLRGAILRLARDERRTVARAPRPDRAERRALDRRRDPSAAIRRGRGAVQGPAPGPDEPAPADLADDGELAQPRACYVCKRLYRRRHFFYDRLCQPCGDASHARRDDRLDLRGRLALVTGGRVKIGHAVALRLLRWGARVIVTTRFPRDAARRFADEPDFREFADRLQIYPLDLRGVPDVERFAAHLAATEPRLDILINNAAQTVWRPPSYYAPLLAEESGDALPEPLRRLLPPAPEPARRDLPAALDLSPATGDDGFGQPLDLRASNSWRLRLHEIEAIEMVEVQLINTVAPALLTARLRPLLARPRSSPRDASFVVQVSAPEGRFYRHYKSPYHPHTNMAKAALNMLTRTSAEDYAADAIYMNSVDTGWISNENPRPIADAMDASGFAPPLDLVDAAARVCDPIVRGLRDGERLWGLFLKDFRAISW